VATFSGEARFYKATFSGIARFNEATFNRGLEFAESRILSPDDENVWPTGWCLQPDGRGGYTLARATDAGRS
jgi:hypothetical protein